MTLVAAAPISWGVSELPGWGFRMPRERVLSEMRRLGFRATELGPSGFLPDDPVACRAALEEEGLRLVGGFLAVVMHDRKLDAVDEIARQAMLLASAGGRVLVLAAALAGDSYDLQRELSPSEWRVLATNLVLAEQVAASRGVRLAFHPHAGTAVASRDQVETLLARTHVGLCLDTGHLTIGGSDPVDLVRREAGRITHVHLKDVDPGLAKAVGANRMAYGDAVRAGLYRPLGQGGLDIEAVCDRLQEAGYEGWFVLEQDTALTADPEPGGGPIAAARQSLDWFRRITSAKQQITASEEE
jgi:inosose dehydratase